MNEIHRIAKNGQKRKEIYVNDNNTEKVNERKEMNEITEVEQQTRKHTKYARNERNPKTHKGISINERSAKE